MNCRVCGGNMEPQEIDMPYKLSNRAIVIAKDLPMLQCENYEGSVIEYPIMDKRKTRRFKGKSSIAQGDFNA